MLMNLNKEDEVHKPRIKRFGAIIVFCSLCAILVTIFFNSKPVSDISDSTGEDYQSIKALGKVMLDGESGYMIPFEFVSILLLVAMIGTVLLSKKEKLEK
jgi:NADH-quinone oxidoreductase subunit J